MTDREVMQMALRALERSAWDTVDGRNAAEALRAQLAKPDDDARDAWQPIETAPVDQRVLIYDPDDRQAVSVRHIGSHWKTHLNTPQGAWQPTHWMPLPKPPAAMRGELPPSEEAESLDCRECRGQGKVKVGARVKPGSTYKTVVDYDTCPVCAGSGHRDDAMRGQPPP